MRRLIIVLIFLVVALGATSFYFYKNSKLSSLNQGSVSQDEIKALVEKVSKILLLPKDEVPTVANITDLKPFRGQAFFVDAKIGYKVLLYDKAKKAVLYDPVANKIINFSTFSVDEKNITSTPDSTIIIDGGDTTKETP